MNSTPVANRMHIGIFGKRNVGKSTFINALTNQDIALVSDVAGTTADPVYKNMELLPVGPVVIIDTAGIDDEGELGILRVSKTLSVLEKTHFGIYIISADTMFDKVDEDFIEQLKSRKIPYLIAINKADINDWDENKIDSFKTLLNCPVIKISSLQKAGIEDVKKCIFENAKFDEADLSILGDLISPGDVVVLVTPIDKAAPKKRLILPQQQVIRDCIDNDAIAVVTKEYELAHTFSILNKKPALVVTDSQAFLKVSADTPLDIPLTSFSILLARYKGELLEMIKGIKALNELENGDKVLIVEGCTHHRQADDIGKVKIPRWIRQLKGYDINFEWASGVSFPTELTQYKGIIHCGGCMLNDREMKYRIELAKSNGVFITNYGMLIAYMQGVLERAIKPFENIHEYYLQNLQD